MEYLHNMKRIRGLVPTVVEELEANDSQAWNEQGDQQLVDTLMKNGKLNVIANDGDQVFVESCSKQSYREAIGRSYDEPDGMIMMGSMSENMQCQKMTMMIQGTQRIVTRQPFV